MVELFTPFRQIGIKRLSNYVHFQLNTVLLTIPQQFRQISLKELKKLSPEMETETISGQQNFDLLNVCELWLYSPLRKR